MEWRVAVFSQQLTQQVQIHPDVVDGFNVDYMIEMMARSHREKKPLQLDWMGF